MADDKDNKSQQDRIRVDSGDASELQYLQSQHPGKSREEIEEAVKKYGPMRENIEAHLRSS